MARDNEFAGRVVVVTGGAGAGIGGAACRRFAALGASVAVLDDHAGRAERTARALVDEFGIAACAAAADVADRGAADAAIAQIEATLGPIDMLVNNAAINIQGSIFDYDPDVFDRVIAVDLTACFYLMRVLLPGMRERGWGRIVNVSSVAAYMGGSGREPAYSAAKAGLNELTRAVALEGGPHGIRCNAVAPGLVHSKWVEKQRERYDTFLDATPLRRHAQPDDVANTIVFLCSDESAHITGEIVTVSGGWYLRP
jgi:NAD(P)-dependent dehydrogenase (short-subunit alcohol dehydrogenase family)